MQLFSIFVSPSIVTNKKVSIFYKYHILNHYNSKFHHFHSICVFTCGDGVGVAQLLQFLDSLKNYEREGVPQGAGTDSDAGFDLQRMHRLLLHLGNPLSCYSVVHVAGTKGKGSTVAFISNILRSAGLSVGTYTSPHLTSIRERITAGKTGDPISDEMLLELFSNLRANLDKAIAAEPGTLTHFEVLTALAFSHFAREKVDLAVVETGLGGARDATNVISAKGLAAAVIVGIGTEHLAALGGSLESIALAKSGIIKDGRPVVVGQQKDSTTKDIILKVAASKEAPVRAAFGSSAQCEVVEVCSGSDAPFQICNFFLDDTSEIESRWEMKNVRLSALGAHQQENALTAISTVLSLRHQGWDIPDSSIRAGLEATVIPGRFQILDQHKAQALGFSNARVILDGAHTEASANALACTLMEYFPTAKLALVVGMASDKDHFAFARSLLEEAPPHLVVTTRVSVAGSLERSTSGAELAQSWCQAAKSANMEVILQSVQQPFVDHRNQNLATHNVSRRTGSADKAAIMAQDYTAETQTPVGSKGSVVVLEAEKMEAAISTAAKYVEQRSDETQRIWVVCITGSLHGVATVLSLLP
ncbi:unnamed protein product [Sphagnum jensenii]|uniref:Mur ligase central domain-containing protein n=1 Tax=Sphagnum jensenii TaxID=128206 RepID=A0ABP0XDQ6_9BRYO